MATFNLKLRSVAMARELVISEVSEKELCATFFADSVEVFRYPVPVGQFGRFLEKWCLAFLGTDVGVSCEFPLDAKL